MKTRRTNVAGRCLALGALTAAALLGLARPAEARLLDLRAGARAGGMTGWGTTANTPDFFERKRGAGAGVEVGARLLIFDFSLNFTQLFDGSGGNGTFTQALVGVAIDIPVGNQYFPKGAIGEGQSKNILRPIVGVGFGIGTPEPINGKLDNAQISDKGLVTRMGLGYEHFFNSFIGAGAQVDFGYHYFLGGGKSMLAANQTHSTGYHLNGFATLTFHLGL
jgi:hypothetical protein